MKRILTILLATAMLVSFTACDDSTEPKETKSTKQTKVTTTAKSTDTTPDTTEASSTTSSTIGADEVSTTTTVAPTAATTPTQPTDEIVSGAYRYYDWSYNITTETLTISGQGAICDGEIRYASNDPDAWFAYADKVKTLIIEEGITEIGSFAFYNMHALRDIRLPASLKEIHEDAFNCCSSLENLVLPDALTALDMNAFSQCDKLQTLLLPESLTHVGAWNPDNNPLLQTTVLGDVTYIGSAANPCFAAIYIAEQCTTPMIADGTVLIAADLGRYNSNITNIILPDSVRHIGEYAFERCKNLSEIILPDGVLTVAQGAFNNSDHGAVVRIPSSIEVLGTNFDSFDPPMTVLNGISYVGNEENPYLVAVAPVDTYPTAVGFADGVRVIATGCFRNCHNLTELIIPDGVVYIGSEAFSNCRNLKMISLPASLRALGNLAFYESTGIEAVTVAGENTAFHVENGALIEAATQTLFWGDSAGCIPEGVKRIAEYAYYQHKDITDIVLPDSVCEIGECAFAASSLASVVLSESLVGIPQAAFRGCNQLNRVAFSEGLRYIEAEAFYGCDVLESIDLPSTLTFLGNYAFYSCDLLPNVVIPEGVRSISAGAFAFCSSLKSVSLPTSLLSIQNEAFRATVLETIDLPVKLDAVSANALPQDGTLTSVTLHRADIYFANGFPASVTDIYFPDGTMEVWNTGNAAGYLAPLSATVHCSDGDIAPIA